MLDTQLLAPDYTDANRTAANLKRTSWPGMSILK